MSADQPLTSVGWIAAIAEALTAMQHLVREAVGQGHDAADPAALAAQVRLFRSAALAGVSQTAARSGALMKTQCAGPPPARPPRRRPVPGSGSANGLQGAKVVGDRQGVVRVGNQADVSVWAYEDQRVLAVCVGRVPGVVDEAAWPDQVGLDDV